ncbi:MAG: phospholipid carrier-dependent glycosyltransferase [Lachnospiraceae bacterium]
MISILYAVGIMDVLFWCILFLKKRNGLPCYRISDLVIFYLFARVLPFMMQEQISTTSAMHLILDFILSIAMAYVIFCRYGRNISRLFYACYLFQPFSIILILFEKSGLQLLPVLLFGIFYVTDLFWKKRPFRWISVIPEFLMLQTGFFCWYIAVRVAGQHLSALNNTRNIPVLYIVSLGIGGFGILSLILRYIFRSNNKLWVPRFSKSTSALPENISSKTCNGFSCTKHTPIEVKDVIWMLVLTTIFGFLVFYRLGSTRVPETEWTLSSGESGSNEIILGFSDEVELAKVHIFLGYNSKRSISFSYLTKDIEEWQMIEADHIVESAFAWNTVEINQKLDRLGMVLMEGNASILEIVCEDINGNYILPYNASYYRTLFDEQGLYPAVRTYYDQTMFDEIYHGRTAYEFLHQLPIYENTHPPLGKTLISLGIRAFGMNPFGWRCICALFGVIMIPVMYLFSHRMFGRTSGAVFTTLLLGSQFMNFTLSRIATIDILVAFFVLLMFYFMYCFIRNLSVGQLDCRQIGQLLFCGCAMACSISIKWTGVYGAIGIAVIFFTFLLQKMNGINNCKKHHNYLIKLSIVCIFCFCVLPLSVYVISYIPFTRVYTDKNLIQTAIDNGKLMLNYHSNTVFDHPYSSPWYDWLIDKRPLLDVYAVYPDGTISTIATFINPLLCYLGLASLVHQFYLFRCRQCSNAKFLLIAYGSVVLPWLLVHRTVFIYQYFIGSLILLLMITNSICHMKKSSLLMGIVATASIAIFILFYPVLSGARIDYNFVNQSLEWLNSWSFAL